MLQTILLKHLESLVKLTENSLRIIREFELHTNPLFLELINQLKDVINVYDKQTKEKLFWQKKKPKEPD